MKKVFIIIILLCFLILEGIATILLPMNLFFDHLYVIPHWVFVFILMVHIFYDEDDTYFSISLAIIFGLLIDIVYTELLGVYMFVYTIGIYVVSFLKQYFQTNFYIIILYYMISLTILEVLIYIIYSVIGYIDINYVLFIWNRLLPTLIANLVFLLILYPIFSKRLVNWRLQSKKH